MADRIYEITTAQLNDIIRDAVVYAIKKLKALRIMMYPKSTKTR